MEQKTMKALVYHEPNNYSLTDVPVPQIIKATDVIGKVTLAAICTSDIHMIHGDIESVPYPKTIGHECCVEIVEVGSEVKGFKPGNRCVVRPGSHCGECTMCKLGLTAMCESGGIFGNVGPLEGCHAEYMRVPVADMEGQMIKIPDGLSEEDVILLPDMLATAWFGIINAQLSVGQTVAVIGVGPVGQCACLLAKKIFMAKQVIAIDILQDRVDIALKEGVADIGINPLTNDVAQKIREATGGLGVNATIDTAGISETIAMAVAVTKPAGIVSTVAVPGEPTMEIPIVEMIIKGIDLKMGIQTLDGVPEMLQLIQEGKIDTSYILTHKSSLNDIMKGYEIFANHDDGCLKWLITPYER